ncbi:MAG TPA: hypothetical protein VFB14_20240 [Bryobacteraceae bacterium]|jgi:hypothetical protein|nr:hypothetical protein [Bryobacteraceae bacterium]
MRDKELDEILDAGLKAYSAVQPRQGLERRVLGHVHSTRRFAWWHWVAVAVPVLACAVGLLLWRQSEPVQTRPATSVETSARAMAPVVRPVVVAKHVRRVGQTPKRMQFPTPAPLTREERALLEFVQRSPKEAAELLGETRDSEIKPIQIQAISIPPIKIENLEEK